VQRKIFEAVYNTKRFYGQGYGWLSGWTNEKMMMNTDGTVNAAAVKGAEGLLGLTGHIDAQGSVRQQYLQLWGAASSKAACTGGATSTRPFCDNDGDGSTLSPSGSFQADSVLLYAKAMDAIYQTGQFDSSVLEQTMLNLSAFDSISGTIFNLDGSGDRVGAFEIENLQIDHSGLRRLRGNPARHLYVALTATTAEFKTVGRFDVVQGLWIYPGSTVIFPGHVQDVPLDHQSVPSHIVTEEEMDATAVVLIIVGVCVMAMIVICAYWYYSRRRLRALKVELEQFKEAIVGVRVVHKNYLPDSDTLPRVGDAWTGSPSTVPCQLRPRCDWYWAEDESRLAVHNPHDVYQPGNFVKYAGAVCAELEEHYLSWLAGDGPEVHRLNLVDRIASTGTERKSFAEDSGYDFEVNYKAMQQVNLKTKYTRSILRVEAAQPKVDAPGAGPAWQVHTRTGSRISAFPEDTCKLQRPMELMADDALQLHTGQLIQTSKQRPDGWGYGSVIYDETEDRKVRTVEGISAMAGWFPLECTSIPNAAQLEKLQARMGGVDALVAPSYWQPVKDPLEPQLFDVAGAERQKVVDAFMQTLNASQVNVVKVERIENMTLWQSFAVKRQTVLQREKDPSSTSDLERIWLFHGTTEDIVPKIVQQGFNRSFCGRNATMYGKGVYFARDSSYSASRAYSKPDAHMVQRMFLCRVVVGEYCKGVKDAVAPNVRSGHVLYDTTVDNVASPSIYVTYHDAQAYPEYLVHFKQS
jgi:poly [ADP-ribose] polymerase 10/14/15